MINLVAKKVFLTGGVGVHREKLNSFEEALRNAQLAPYNLVTVSSIVPPKCVLIAPMHGIPHLKYGQIVFCVMSRNETSEHGRLLSSAVALLMPEDNNDYGYISEFHSFGMEHKEVDDYVADQAAELYCSAKGLKLDWKKAWSEENATYTLNGREYEPETFVQMAKGSKGLWTTTVAAAVFVM